MEPAERLRRMQYDSARTFDCGLPAGFGWFGPVFSTAPVAVRSESSAVVQGMWAATALAYRPGDGSGERPWLRFGGVLAESLPQNHFIGKLGRPKGRPEGRPEGREGHGVSGRIGSGRTHSR